MNELGEVVCGEVPGRKRPDEATLFKSNGLAIEDIATGRKVLERARAEGAGAEIPLTI